MRAGARCGAGRSSVKMAEGVALRASLGIGRHCLVLLRCCCWRKGPTHESGRLMRVATFKGAEFSWRLIVGVSAPLRWQPRSVAMQALRATTRSAWLGCQGLTALGA